MTEAVCSNKQPILWASTIRIVATLLIYIVHFAVLSHYNITLVIDKIAISLFLFIAGFFAVSNLSSTRWIIKRIISIYIPYWPIIITALIANHIIEYKPSNFLKDFIIFIGGSMFVEDPVYIISWFISLIMLFYLFIFILRNISNKLLIALYISTAFYFFNFYLEIHYMYFPAFLAGYTIHLFLKKKNQFAPINIFSSNIIFHNKNFYNKLNNYLFDLQNYCYSFFLLHGGVLWILIKYFKINGFLAFILGLCFTSTLSFIHYNISRKIITFVSTKILK